MSCSSSALNMSTTDGQLSRSIDDYDMYNTSIRRRGTSPTGTGRRRPMRPYRSMLFLPGHKPSWVEKAIRSGADSIVLDLEDSVPADDKAAARAGRGRVGRQGQGDRAARRRPGPGQRAVHRRDRRRPGGRDGAGPGRGLRAQGRGRRSTRCGSTRSWSGSSGATASTTCELAIPMETARALSPTWRRSRSASPRIAAVIGVHRRARRRGPGDRLRVDAGRAGDARRTDRASCSPAGWRGSTR